VEQRRGACDDQSRDGECEAWGGEGRSGVHG
jgi:hypothetical protein